MLNPVRNRSVFFLSIFIISFFGFLICGQSVRAGILRDPHVQPNASSTDDLIGQSNAQWKFTMTNDVALADGDVIQVIFPIPTNAPYFELQNPTVTATSSITLATTTEYNGGTRILAFTAATTTAASTTFSITANQIYNPSSNLSNLQNLGWSFKTGTPADAQHPAGALSVTKDVSATTTASLIRGGGIIVSDFNSSITPSSYVAAATNVTYTFAFTASTSIPSGGKVAINFPSEFTLTGAATTTADDDINGAGAGTIRIITLTTQTTEGRNRVILTTSGGATVHDDIITVAVTGLTNPALGVYRPFFVYTTNANNGLIDGSPFGGGDDNNFAGTVPPVDTVHIGGTNNITVSVYKENASSVYVPLSGGDLTAVMVGVGCPDKQFFVGFRYLNANASTTFNNLLDCNYKIGIMPAGGNSFAFFDDKLQPGMTDVSVSGGITKSIDLNFGRPNAVWIGTITGGVPNDTSGAGIMAYNSQYMAFSPIFTSTSYNTEGFNGSGTGYFNLKVKTASSWTLSFEGGVLISGGNKYWPPVMPTIYASSTATTSLGSFAYRWANNDLTITLKKSDTGDTITDNTCVGVRMTGGGEFMANQQVICTAPYAFKVPVGSLTVEVMKPGVGAPEEYPVAITASSTPKTIYIAAPSTYINLLVIDSSGTKYKNAPVFAQSSNGFGQGMTDANGEAVLYVPPGTYRVEGFIPSMGPLTAKTGIVVSAGSYASTTFTIDTSGYKLISGTVTQGGSPASGVQIGARGVSGTTGGNGTVTGSDGTYRLYVPAGTYSVGGWSEATGGLQEQTANVSSSNATLNWTLAAGGVLRIIVIGGQNVSPLFGGAFDATTNKGNGTDTWTASSTDKYADLRLPQGTYQVHVGSPITGEISCTGGSSVAVGANTTVYCNATAIGTMVALTGTVTSSGAAVEDANVWVSRVGGPGFFSTLTDSSGAYSIKAPDTYTYKIGVKKLGYVGTDVSKTLSGATTTNFALTAAGSTITGQVLVGSTGLADAWVSAKKTSADTWTGAPTDSSGRYSLDVDSSSVWTIYAEGPCYNRSTGLSASAGDSGKNITLSAISGCVANAPQVSGLSPATGGQVSNGDRMTINIPAKALGDGSDSVSVSVKTADMAVSTPNATPLKNSVQEITATSISGSTITTITSLNTSASLTLTYNESDLPPGYNENNIQLAYFDTTTGQWEPVAATVDTTNNTLTAQISHFTPYGPIIEGVPDPPENLSASAPGSSQINLTWNSVSTATSYKVYRSATSGGTFSLIGTASSASYSDTGLIWSTTYYYKATAVNANGESAYSSEANATTAPYLGGGGGGGITSGDTAAPSVSAITASVGDTTATIAWTTNEASLSWIVYGLTTAYGSEQKTTAYATSHSLTLTGLSIGTTYHYQVKSKDSTGNIGSYTDKTFTTSGTPTTPTIPTTPTTPTVTTGALAPASATNTTGYTLMKAIGSNDVWVIQNGLKLPVRSIDVFTSSGYGLATVKTVSANALKAVEAASLIKTNENPDVYRLENNFRRKLASIEIFNDYKLNWNKISVISRSVMDSFSYAPIYKHGFDLYWRDASNILHKFPTMTIFTAKGYNIRDLVPVNDFEFGSFGVGEQISD